MNVAEHINWASSSGQLVARCLGRFRLEDSSGKQLQIRTRKARALLAALSLSGRPMSRDALADLLWSDRGSAQARASLRQTIFELQHFESGEAPVLVVGRDDLAIRHEQLVTDIELIRAAAGTGDWARLLALLENSESGLLTDLDGLDAEFDDWLRAQRGQEPARILAIAVGAAERCLAEAGPRVALDLVSEILRLDPVSEEATRLALQIDHQLGDNRALHGRFNALRDRLRDEYSAEPSSETVALFNRLTSGSGAPEPRSSETASVGDGHRGSLRWGNLRAGLIAAAVVALAVVGAFFLSWSRGDAGEAPQEILIAVLPFEEQGRETSALAQGLWDDTRMALSRNPGLRVLGQTTTRATIDQGLRPDQYRKRFDVDYLLEGSVRRSGDQAIVTTSLTRTSDGVAVWQHAFRGRTGDPLALQDAIANGIEGRLRGRLATGGGRRAENIATTPEVYAMFSEARALLRDRSLLKARRAQALLRQAVAADPNYAPAWAHLGLAIYFSEAAPIRDSRARAESIDAARHALSLAPNLAQAHGVLALLEGGSSPAAEKLLRRAVELDPSYAEAWNWLGNWYHSRYRLRESLAAYQHAFAIDPLWTVAADNIILTASDLRDQGAIDRVLRDLLKAGAGREVMANARAQVFLYRGDYSNAGKQLMMTGRDSQGRSLPAVWTIWFETLTGLGHYDALKLINNCPDWFAPMLSGKSPPPKVVAGKGVEPEEFLTSIFFSAAASRALVNHGQASELVRIYRAAFPTADGFISRSTDAAMLAELAPTLSMALKSTGARQEASYVLSVAAEQVEQGLGVSPRFRFALSRLAAIRAAQGERDKALRLLTDAVSEGYLPDGRAAALDLADEPAFRDLRGDPRFEALRKRILAHIAKERAELGPLN